MSFLWYCLSFLMRCMSFFFFFNDTATTEIYTLSLHDALPIYFHRRGQLTDTPPPPHAARHGGTLQPVASGVAEDRKSTRLNSSHGYISYAVFCLKKKKKKSMYAVYLNIDII